MKSCHLGLSLLFVTALFPLVTARAGGPNSLHLCMGGANHGNFCIVDSQCPGGECQDLPFTCNDGPDAGNLCLTDADCTDGACVMIGRFQKPLPRVCQGGVNKGAACGQDSNCPGSSCVLNLLNPGLIKGTLTLIVDDDQVLGSTGSNLGSCVGVPPQQATTLLLEVKKSGTSHMLSQTYRCINPQVEGLAFAWRESELNNSVDNATILNSLLFRPIGGGLGAPGDMDQALRDIFASTGRPVIIETPHLLSSVKRTDREGDGLSSVVRLSVKIGFVPACYPNC